MTVACWGWMPVESLDAQRDWNWVEAKAATRDAASELRTEDKKAHETDNELAVRTAALRVQTTAEPMASSMAPHLAGPTATRSGTSTAEPRAPMMAASTVTTTEYWTACRTAVWTASPTAHATAVPTVPSSAGQTDAH